MSNKMPQFDGEKYKAATQAQWDQSGGGYNDWGNVIRELIEEATISMLDQSSIREGSRVLELAAGSGELTRMLAKRVGATGSVLATDLSPGILSLAVENMKKDGLDNVQTRVMDGEKVDEQEGRYDAVVSSLGLMFFPDPLTSLNQQVAAVKKGGSVAALVISVPDKNPFFSIPAKVIRERADLPPPAPGTPGPFALGAPGLLSTLFEKAGLKSVSSQTYSSFVSLPSTEAFIKFLGDAFGALHMMMSNMDEKEKEATWNAVAESVSSFSGPQGFQAPAEMVVCVGTK